MIVTESELDLPFSSVTVSWKTIEVEAAGAVNVGITALSSSSVTGVPNVCTHK